MSADKQPDGKAPMRTMNKSSVPDESRDALRYMLEAWHTAINEGLEPDFLANAALFTALSGLVSSYGEEAVAQLADGLGRRIRRGEFTFADRVQ